MKLPNDTPAYRAQMQADTARSTSFEHFVRLRIAGGYWVPERHRPAA
jgi:hypothetical protein